MSKYSQQELAAIAASRPRRAISVAERIELTGTDECLACWKEWMGRNDTDLGVKSQSTLKGDSDGYGSDDTSQMRMDNKIAEATNAQILSLRISHRWAIRVHTGVATMRCWNFPQLDFVKEAQDARAELEVLLKKNVVTRLLFR